MKNSILAAFLFLFAFRDFAADPDIQRLQEQLNALTKRVAALEEQNAQLKREATFDRLVVKKELIVSDTGEPWEPGYQAQQIPRGIYARSLFGGPGGLWVRSRLIKAELDDPFDDRFHALERNGFRTAPGHISWNVWLDGHWRQMAIIQGEGLELSEIPRDAWSGGNHPGRIRFQTYRPHHDEPLTDAVLGQGMLSVGGGGFGGGGLPYARDTLQLWGGELKVMSLETPGAPSLVSDDGSGAHTYTLIAVGPQGKESSPSAPLKTAGLASLQWDSVSGADSYILVRDGKRIGPLRIEGAQKRWIDRR